MPLQPDSMLGPYRIGGLLGEGGMGAVYRAKDTRLGRDVAIKVLTNINLEDRERLQRFEQEARATGMLNHPNLLTVYDVGTSEGAPFLVTELLEGETLRDRLSRGVISARIAGEVGLQMAHGLAAAHEKGVVHRDLKPENIFLTRDRRVKILDFGIAKLNAGLVGSEGPTFTPAATEPGMVLGTVGYMSPEQVRGEQVDPRSDIFAFGAILYEMLSGQRAFKRNSGIETLSAILKEEPTDLTEINANVPQPLERLVRRCLEKDREHRFQTARDLAFNLETLSTLSSQSTFSGSTANPMSSPATAGSPAVMRTSSSIPTTSLRTSATAAAASPTTRTTSIPPRRPTLANIPRPKPGISPALLGLLYLVSIAGAAFGGWYLANRMRQEAPEVAYHRMTFRRGDVHLGRFGPDGDTFVYSAAWDGKPPEIFIATRQSPDARPLGIPEADILAVSKSTELAIMLRRDRVTGLGTLARVPIAGGLPREVADQVQEADWSPDGNNLAIIRVVNGKSRIESPIGTVQHETVHAVGDLRFSPDGSRIAFIEQIQGERHVSVIERHSASTVAKGWPHGVSGLAWSPDGKEIWITGTATAEPPALYAINAGSGEQRLVARLTGTMKIFDISAAGRVLLTNGVWRAALEYQAPGETSAHDAAWLDWSWLADLSPDGKAILFSEGREGGGAKKAVYLRRSDAPTPVRLGDGFADGLSPDGKVALCHSPERKLVLLPTGTGETRELKIQGSFDNGAVWFSDNKRVVIAGALEKHGYQLHLLDTLDETIRPISPENIAGSGSGARPFALSPDGRFVAGLTEQRTIALYPTEGSAPPTPVAASQEGEVPAQWSADGTMLYVYRPNTPPPVDVVRINLATGARETWKQFTPIDPAGVYKIMPICITADASSYAYNALRTLSDLYVAEGLR
jgi:serine/threonine protein kinase/WD40 repeat protein